MELTHTLEVRKNLYIRAMIRFYGLSAPYELNTCKLFWGGIGMILLPLLFLALSPIGLSVLGLMWVAEKIKEYNVARHPSHRRREVLSPEAREPKTRAEWLDKLSVMASAVWFRVQTPVTWFFRVLIGGAILVGVTILVTFLINVLPGLPWSEILSLTWKVLLGAALVVPTIGGLIFAVLRWRGTHPPKPKAPKKPSVLKAVFASIHDHTCANVKVAD